VAPTSSARNSHDLVAHVRLAEVADGDEHQGRAVVGVGQPGHRRGQREVASVRKVLAFV
jgi:hypothetical protein